MGNFLRLTAGRPASSAETGGGSSSSKNWLINSTFGLFQNEGVDGAALNSSAGTTAGYFIDGWYGATKFGGGSTTGRSTGVQLAPTLAGSKLYPNLFAPPVGGSGARNFGALSVKVTTAPSDGSPTAGSSLFQSLTDVDTNNFYNNTASFGIQIKALGNVTQVGISILYNTNEKLVSNNSTLIGSEVLTTVNTSTFTQCTLTGQSIGTSMGTTGCIGVRVRVTAVSSGNLYDVNNGFAAEQAMLVLGSSLPSHFITRGDTAIDELRLCQIFFETSWDYFYSSNSSGLPNTGSLQPNTVSGAVTSFSMAGGSSYLPVNARYSVRKRTGTKYGSNNDSYPKVTTYSTITNPTGGGTGKATDIQAAADTTLVTLTSDHASLIGIHCLETSSSFTNNKLYGFFWKTDARLFDVA